MVKEIQLTKGKVALVDDEDYELLNQYKWVAFLNGCNNWYAYRSVRINKRSYFIAMHNVILKPHKGLICDHINGNSLDNRRINLRECTNTENIRNQKLQSRIKSSVFKGVHYSQRDKVWIAKVVVNKKDISLGTFRSEIKAGLAYDEGAKKYYGEFARLNFIEV
jgi:hypothetical protein